MRCLSRIPTRRQPGNAGRPDVFVPNEGYRMEEAGLAAAHESMATWPIVVFLPANFGLPRSGARQSIR